MNKSSRYSFESGWARLWKDDSRYSCDCGDKEEIKQKCILRYGYLGGSRACEM